MANLLVVDDEPSICWGLERLATSLDHQVQSASSAEEGLQFASANKYDLLLLDVRLPGMSGLEALKQFQQHLGHAPIVVMTAFGALEVAVEALQKQAFDYLLKPFDLKEVRSIIERALASRTPAPASQAPARPKTEMVGSSPAMQNLYKRIALAAASNTNVLVQGESGTGKELVARAVHRHSQRSAGEFVAVNAAALSPTLAEAELFGHTTGAFTGADRDRPGLLVQASGGTLFLDEVADIPLPLQVKLLRAIEQGEVLPVGGDRPVSTDLRVIAATHRDLRKLVEQGTFRHDLYYRLTSFELRLPPLRDRLDDLPELAEYFVAAQAAAQGTGEHDTAPLRLAPSTIEQLRYRTWHGNVRELRNAIEHAAVLARQGAILPEHLPAEQRPLSDIGSEEESDSLAQVALARASELLDDPEQSGQIYETLMREVETPLLRMAVQRHRGEIAPAARELGLHRTTLKRKLDQSEDASDDHV